MQKKKYFLLDRSNVAIDAVDAFTYARAKKAFIKQGHAILSCNIVSENELKKLQP